jgi:hypothetical protein
MNVAVFEGDNEVIVLPVDENLIPIGAEGWFEDCGRQYNEYEFNIVSLDGGFSIETSARLDCYDHGFCPNPDVPAFEKWHNNKLEKENK